MVTKRFIYSFSTLILVVFGAKSQNSLTNENSPFRFEGSYVGDVVANVSGGIKTGTAYLGMANLKMSFDTEKAKAWKGGSFFVNLANTHGDSPSETLIGDFQISSNIEAGNHSYLQELWYGQVINKVTFKVGLQDLNVELANSEHGALYRNSSFGVHSTISNNVPAPIFPLTTLGFTFLWDFKPKWNRYFAVYDGAPIDFEHNPHNLSWSINKYDGALFITEFQRVDLFQNLPKGTYKIGAFCHEHKLDELEKLIGLDEVNYGFYGVMDQMLWQNSAGQGMGIFTQISVSPKKENTHTWYIGGGANWYGVGKRKQDVLGIAVATAGFKDNKSCETTLELTYKAVLTENIYLQPDFQYITHPSGTSELLKNATVASLRIGLDF